MKTGSRVLSHDESVSHHTQQSVALRQCELQHWLFTRLPCACARCAAVSQSVSRHVCAAARTDQ